MRKFVSRFVVCFSFLFLAVTFGWSIFMYLLGAIPPGTEIYWRIRIFEEGTFWYILGGSLFLSWVIGYLRRPSDIESYDIIQPTKYTPKKSVK